VRYLGGDLPRYYVTLVVEKGGLLDLTDIKVKVIPELN
jgi:hypothetical protein